MITHLAFRICPKLDSHRNEVVQRRIGALIQQDSRKSREGQERQAGLETAVDGRAGNKRQRPFPGHHPEPNDEIDDLERGKRFHGEIQCLGGKVPKDLGPEEGLDRGADLVYSTHMSVSLLERSHCIWVKGEGLCSTYRLLRSG